MGLCEEIQLDQEICNSVTAGILSSIYYSSNHSSTPLSNYPNAYHSPHQSMSLTINLHLHMSA
jgi:hypothetical protein